MKVGVKRLVLIVLFVLISTLIAATATRYDIPYISIILGVTFIGGLFLLVRWNSKNTAYVCPKCNEQFSISTLTDFLSPHMVTMKLLKCPGCGALSWCIAVDKD